MKISSFRPIYYLGCKSSFTSEIEAAINEVDPSGGRVCDLFSGSGVVGASLRSKRAITAVDIQEYSRVLSSALLSPAELRLEFIENFIDSIEDDLKNSSIMEIVNPLIDYEYDSINAAVAGDSTQLVGLLEDVPLQIYSQESSGRSHSKLGAAKRDVATRLQKQSLCEDPDTTVLRYFGGIYFSYYQSAILDAIFARIDTYGEEFRDTLKAAALSTASAIVNTIGKQFAQPIRPKDKSGSVKNSVLKAVLRDRTMDVLKTLRFWLLRYAGLPIQTNESFALRRDYLDALGQYGSTFSVIYADPPYTRDHYSRFYHVLETMCLRDNPSVSQVTKSGRRELSRGFYREDRHQSPFCIRSTAPKAFDSLFKTSRESELPIVLSYSPHEAGDGTHPRVVSTSQILNIARNYYSRVELTKIDGVTHSKLNRNDLKLQTREHAEILIKCFI